jgi:regulator of replication initiation timing
MEEIIESILKCNKKQSDSISSLSNSMFVLIEEIASLKKENEKLNARLNRLEASNNTVNL